MTTDRCARMCESTRDTRQPCIATVDSLVFAGSGVRAVSYVGSLFVLHELLSSGSMRRDRIRSCAGTSSGAWMALMVVIGASPHKLYNMILYQDQTTDYAPEFEIGALMSELGMSQGHSLKRFILDTMSSSTILRRVWHDDAPSRNQSVSSTTTLLERMERLTMRELYLMTGIHLSITASNVSTHVHEYIDHVSRPHVPVWKAVLASMSIPILFAPVTIDGDVFVDGALVDNAPCNAIMDSCRHTLLFHVTEDSSCQLNSETKGIGRLWRYVVSLLHCVTERTYANDRTKSGVTCIDIPVRHTSITNFALSRREKLDMVIRGIVFTYCGMCHSLSFTPRQSQTARAHLRSSVES